jgi:hypothetical protein
MWMVELLPWSADPFRQRRKDRMQDSNDNPQDKTRPGMGRLGRRLALLVATAMLPLAVLSFVQTQSLQTEIDARSELALRGQTLQAAEPLIQMIRRAEATAEPLALTRTRWRAAIEWQTYRRPILNIRW